MDEEPTDTTARFERMLEGASDDVYDLQLFVSGMTARSVEAIRTVRTLCEQYLRGRYLLEVVDIYSEPMRAREEQVIAAPTLVRRLPPPVRQLIGGLSDPGRILDGLEVLVPEGDQPDGPG